MRKLLRQFWDHLAHLWPVAPGIFVCLLGTEALLITLIPSDVLSNRRWLKSAAIVLGTLLTAGEIWMIGLDRASSDAQHAQDMRQIFVRFVKLDQDVLALHNNTAITQQTRTLPRDNLKRRAIDLSNEILEFLISREAPPGFSQGGFGEGPYGGKPLDTRDYDKETLQSYINVFQSRVDNIHDDLKHRGLTDDRLEAEYEHPVNAFSIRTVAQRIAALAAELP